ncbi:MAG: hypothetical protein AAF571_02800 [Verrucomicrobiota bacterium]
MKNYQNFRKVSMFVAAVIALASVNVDINAAESVTISGAVRSAEIKTIDNGTVVTGKLALTEYSGQTWTNHYHVTVIGAKGEMLDKVVYRHGLKAPKAQSRQSSRPYRFVIEGISPDTISAIHFERVSKSHGSCG